MKSYYGGPIGTHQRSFERYHPRPLMVSPSQRLGVRNPNPKLQSLLSQETGKATKFKFGRYIHRVHPNKSPVQIWEKRSVGVSRNCPNFWVPPIILGMGKATKFKFCTHIHRVDRKKSPLTISAKVALGVLRNSLKFSGHPYIWRIALICAVAHLSCYFSDMFPRRHPILLIFSRNIVEIVRIQARRFFAIKPRKGWKVVYRL